MSISRNQIQAFAATALAGASSVSAFFLEPYISKASTTEKTLAAILVAPALYAIFRATEVVLRRLYYRKVLGEWYYVTVASSAFVDDGFASMRFYFNSQGQLHYNVQLYPDMRSLLSGANAKGTAISEALEYDAERDDLHILYSVNLISDSIERRGRLFLTLTRNNELIGEWGSVVEGRAVSQGRMFAARPDVFQEKLKNWRDFEKVDTA